MESVISNGNSGSSSRFIGDLSGLKFLVVGCGFYGAVMAERIASVLNEKVLVLDVREHIGGNAHSYTDSATNIEVHAYGSHIFHTSNAAVWEYVTSFEKFNSYRHKVYTTYQGQVYAMPINLHTINQFFRKNMAPDDARQFVLEEIRQSYIANPANLEEKAISLIGEKLYTAFVKGYTEKQWGCDARDLPSNIITRLPVRFDYNNRYFSDKWEGQPLGGYGALFQKIIKHKNISVELGINYFTIRDLVPRDCTIIYTGPIDRYFDYKLGVLGWRTVDFKWRREATGDFQGTAVMNYADKGVPYTRIHEFKHYHPERDNPIKQTIICEVFSRAAGRNDDPYYPINTEADKRMHSLYKELGKKTTKTIFGGRLGNYVYIDMHQAIAMALNDFDQLRRRA